MRKGSVRSKNTAIGPLSTSLLLWRSRRRDLCGSERRPAERASVGRRLLRRSEDDRLREEAGLVRSVADETGSYSDETLQRPFRASDRQAAGLPDIPPPDAVQNAPDETPRRAQLVRKQDRNLRRRSYWTGRDIRSPYEHELAPSSINTDGARRVMRRLCEEANLELEGKHDYLVPYGGRRGAGSLAWVHCSYLSVR